MSRGEITYNVNRKELILKERKRLQNKLPFLYYITLKKIKNAIFK